MSISTVQEQVVLVNNQPVFVPVRVPVQGEFVVIDTINFVVGLQSFDSFEMYSLDTTLPQVFALDLNAEQYDDLMAMVVREIGIMATQIFGEHFSKIMPVGRGIHYYKHSYTVKTDEGGVLLNIGIGGQNNTVFFGLTGLGTKLADDGWESRLYDFLANQAENARITRIDLAHDDFGGNYSSFHLANQAESDDKFITAMTRNRPAVQYAGEVKHDDPYNKGLTLYVGSRKNGKVFRGYEKGKQLGDDGSNWFRGEVELHNKKRLIPFDILLSPTQYFAGFYPYCDELIQLANEFKKNSDNTNNSSIVSKKIKCVKNESSISLNRAIEIFKTQFGCYLKVFKEIFMKRSSNGKPLLDAYGNYIPDYEFIVNTLVTDKEQDYYPKRLVMVANQYGTKEVFGNIGDKIKNFKKEHKFNPKFEGIFDFEKNQEFLKNLALVHQPNDYDDVWAFS